MNNLWITLVSFGLLAFFHSLPLLHSIKYRNHLNSDFQFNKPFRLLVPVSSIHYCTSTSGLSTWSSSTPLIGIISLGTSFTLRCFQRLSLPYCSHPAMPLARQQVHQWYVHSGPLVLGTASLNYPSPTADRDRTVSRRSEPSSRTTLIGEQPNPWDLLQPQDVMSRHRGAKLRRRCELLGGISLLSPAYLLSVERWPFHSGPPDHYDLLSYLLEMSLSQSS